MPDEKTYTGLTVGLGDIPTGTDPQLREWLERLREVIEVTFEGRGDEKHIAVLRGDLESIGIDPATVNPSNPGYDFSQQIPGLSNLPKPSKPTNLLIDYRVTDVKITFTPVPSDDFLYTEIWASPVNDVRVPEAFLVGSSAGSQLTHTLMLVGEQFYYFARTVTLGRENNYSDWSPGPTSGVSDTPPTFQSINEAMAALTNDELYRTTYRVVADSFVIVQPLADVPAWDTTEEYTRNATVLDGAAYYQSRLDANVGNRPSLSPQWWEIVPDGALNQSRRIFTAGYANGVPTIGIAAEMYLDGSILARHVSAGQIDGTHINAQSFIDIADGGMLRVGNNVTVRSDDANNKGSIEIKPDVFDATHKTFTTLTEDGIKISYLLDPANEFSAVTYSALKHVEVFIASNRTKTRVPGYFKFAPQIIMFPNNLMSINGTYCTQDQNFTLNVLAVVEDPIGSMIWYFTPQAELTISAGTVTLDKTALKYPSSSDAIYTAWMVHGVYSVIARFYAYWTAKSLRATSIIGVYNKRQYRYKCKYSNGASTYESAFSGWNAFPADTTSPISGSYPSPVLAAAGWDVQMVFEFADASGTFGVPQYENITLPQTAYSAPSLTNSFIGWDGFSQQTKSSNFATPNINVAFPTLQSYLDAGYAITQVRADCTTTFTFSSSFCYGQDSFSASTSSDIPGLGTSWEYTPHETTFPISFTETQANITAAVTTNTWPSYFTITESWDCNSSSTSKGTVSVSILCKLTISLHKSFPAWSAHTENEADMIKLDLELSSSVILDSDGVVTALAVGE